MQIEGIVVFNRVKGIEHSPLLVRFRARYFGEQPSAGPLRKNGLFFTQPISNLLRGKAHRSADVKRRQCAGKWTAKLRAGENRRKKAALCGISARFRETFSELQTEWRREWDSNPPNG
jgi:hypothetical protein